MSFPAKLTPTTLQPSKGKNSRRAEKEIQSSASNKGRPSELNQKTNSPRVYINIHTGRRLFTPEWAKNPFLFMSCELMGV